MNIIQPTSQGVALYQSSNVKSANLVFDPAKNTQPLAEKTTAPNPANANSAILTAVTSQTQAQMIAQADDASEVTAILDSDNNSKKYDFSNMTRKEISDAGKQLFHDGKITLDELLRFDHPDGKLHISLDGRPIELNPDDRIDFIAATQKAVSDMEQTGESKRSDSGYKMMLELLNKLNVLQG